MSIYRISTPNDYNSDADWASLEEQFPGLEGEELQSSAFEEIHRLWPGLELIEATDFGGIFEAATPPPDELPRWAWVSEEEEE